MSATLKLHGYGLGTKIYSVIASCVDGENKFTIMKQWRPSIYLSFGLRGLQQIIFLKAVTSWEREQETDMQ